MSDIEKSPSAGDDIDYSAKEKDSTTQIEDFSSPAEAVAAFVAPTPAEEKAVIRKLDLRLMPLVFVLYMLAVLDRSNLGNAKLAGLEDAIDLSGYRYNWLGTLFYISYICSQWLLIGWKHFPPHIYCSCVVLLWGIIATLQASVQNWGSLMVCRFFLGITEAAYGPGVPLYLTYFYPKEKVALRHGVFIAGAAMANAYGGALAYGISQINGSLAPWQILFIIEGLPTCAFAVLTWFALPDSVVKARFLSEREKQVATYFVARNQQLDVGKDTQGLNFRELLSGIIDPKSFIPGMMYFGCNVSFASLPLFLPTIIAGFGTFGQAKSNGLSAPPYLACFFYIIIICYLSDRFKMRGPFCALSAMIAAIGFIIQATTYSTGPRYFATFLSVQIFACVALLLAWTANIHSTESKRAGGYTVLATVGQCGPLLGTNVFPESEGPYYHKGMWISAAFCLLVFFLSIVLSFWLIYENKKLDRQEATVRPDEGYGEDGEAVGAGRGQPQRHRFIW